MLDNLGSLWWAKLGGSLVRSILSSNEPLIFGSVLLGLLNFLLGLSLKNSVENSNLKKTEFYNISVFLGFLAPVETNRKLART